MKKILILYTSHTHGHKAVAENIGFYLEQAGYEVKLSDVLKLAGVEYYSDISTLKGRHVEFVSCDFCKVLLKKITLPVCLKVFRINFYLCYLFLLP